MAQTESAPSVDLPDRTYDWGTHRTCRETATVASPNSNKFDLVELGSGCTATASALGIVVEGLHEYKAKYGGEVIDFPSTYRDIQDEFTPILTYASAGNPRRSYGYGITPHRLEAGIRLATGGGRFSTGEITVTECGDAPFIVETGNEAVLVAPEAVDRDEMTPIDGSMPFSTRDVDGITVTDEQNKAVLDGVKEFVSIVSDFLGYTITGHEERSASAHYFTTKSGTRLRIDSRELQALADEKPHEQNDTELLGTHSVELPDGTVRDLSWDSFEFEPNEQYRLHGTCIGRTLNVEHSCLYFSGPTKGILEEKAWFISESPVSESLVSVEIGTTTVEKDRT